MTTAQEIQYVQGQFEPIAKKLEELRYRKRKEDSVEFVRVNNITKADVELSDGDKPFFGNVLSFITWMKEQGVSKRFAEWNTRLYFISDLFAGKMVETPGFLEDVPND